MAWKKVAKDTVGLLSAEAGRHPYDWRLSDLIGELSTRSDEFVSGGPPPTSRFTAPASSTSSASPGTPIAQSEMATFANGWLTKMIKARLHLQQSGPD
jgi:hypothetical protein